MIKVASVSSFLHRPGQVQYLQVHSIATNPHLYGKGHLQTAIRVKHIQAWRNVLKTPWNLPLQYIGHQPSQFCMDLHSKQVKAECKPAKLTM